ncbi:MAG: lysophospholipid acyltransferase family protein [Elusimicrobiota bacterium]
MNFNILRRYLLYLFVVTLKSAVEILPWKAAVSSGTFFGFLGYYLAPSEYRRRAQKNLRNAFPGKTENEIRSLTKRVFENQGRNLFEVFLFPRINKSNIDEKVELKGKENFEKARAEGKGVFFLASHFGNWELLGAALALNGIPLNVIAREVFIEGLDKIINELRESKGMKIIKRGGQDSPRAILRALKRNEAIALIIDQNTNYTPGVFVNFFNRRAYTPSGLASLALRTGAPVLPITITRQGYFSRAEIGEPIELKHSGNIEADVRANTQLFTDIIESYVREYPEQWVWFHNRWEN